MMQKRKIKYLNQLILTSCILIIVPSVFFFSFIWRKTANEVEELNKTYHVEMVSFFSDRFSNEILQLKNYAVVFAQNSRMIDGGLDIIYEGSQNMRDNPKYYEKACRVISDYTQKIVIDFMGIYYYGKDLVIDKRYKYTVNSFLKEGLEIATSDQMQIQRVTDCFAESTYTLLKSIYVPIYDEDGIFKELLFGVCVELGKNKEPGLVMFKLSGKDFDEFNLSSLGKNWARYYVVDNEAREIVFVIGDENLRNVESVLSVVENKSSIPNWFLVQNEKRGLTFVLDGTDNISQKSLLKFYRDMKMLIVYIVIVMLLIGCVAVWYNYKPIYNLLELTKRKEGNEIEAIYFELNERKLQLSEQSMMIIDLIMNRLIYGIPISKDHIDKLGISGDISGYCVFLIKKHVLNSSEVEQIIETVEREFSTLLFVTDLQGEKSTVIIAFLENDKIEVIGEWIENWCAANIAEEHLVLRGLFVKDINDIQKSFKCCTNSQVHQVEDSDDLKQNVLNYLEEHFRDEDLCQTKVADYFQISVYSLSRLFKYQIKVGFTEYIANKRFEYAKELLVTTDLPVKEVARMVGIEDANYFARIFKQYIGKSPSSFRKMNIND